MTEKPDCEVCRRIQKDSQNCDECLPLLKPENEEAINIYFRVCNQLIIVPTFEKAIVIDINHASIWRLIDELKIEGRDRMKTFDKVLKIFQAMQENSKRAETMKAFQGAK